MDLLDYDFKHSTGSRYKSYSGALMVMATAGTGKTSLLALRIEKALKDWFKARKMLCLTFTNLVVRQLR